MYVCTFPLLQGFEGGKHFPLFHSPLNLKLGKVAYHRIRAARNPEE